MATKTWISVDGNLTAASSWLPSGTPTTGDNVVFGSESQVSPSSNLDGLAGVALASVWVRSDYTAQWGLAGTPIEIGTIAATHIVYQGKGDCYFGGTWGPLTFTWDSDATCYASNSTMCNTLFIRRGRVVMSAGAGIAGNAFVMDDAAGTSPIFIWPADPAASGPIGDIYVSGGTVILGQETTRLHVSGGVVTKTDDSLTTLIMTGGVFELEITSAISSVFILGGTLDATTTGDAKTLGVTVLGPGGEILDNGNLARGTFYDMRPEKPLTP